MFDLGPSMGLMQRFGGGMPRFGMQNPGMPGPQNSEVPIGSMVPPSNDIVQGPSMPRTIPSMGGGMMGYRPPFGGGISGGMPSPQLGQNPQRGMGGHGLWDVYNRMHGMQSSTGPTSPRPMMY